MASGPPTFTTAKQAATYFGRSVKEVAIVVTDDLTPKQGANYLALDEDELVGLSGPTLPDLPDITITPTPSTGIAPQEVTVSAVNSGGTATEWEFRPYGGGTDPVITTAPPWVHEYGSGTHTLYAKATNATGSDTDTAQVNFVAP